MTQRNASTSSAQSETRSLQKSGFETAAALLHATVQGDSSQHVEIFLATHLYLRACRFQLAQSFNNIQ